MSNPYWDFFLQDPVAVLGVGVGTCLVVLGNVKSYLDTRKAFLENKKLQSELERMATEQRKAESPIHTPTDEEVAAYGSQRQGGGWLSRGLGAAIVVVVLGRLAVQQHLEGAAYQQQIKSLETANNEHASRERVLESQVADLQTVRTELQHASVSLQQLVQQRETELAALRTTQDELVSELRKELESNQVQIKRFRDQLRVDLVDEILFDSGEVDVKPHGREVLARVADVLKKTAHDRRLEIAGHTDNVPITGALAKRYPTNWELSAARAVNVARILQQGGIDPKQLVPVARGEFEPRAGNETEDGRRKNRRIEIVLSPSPTGATTHDVEASRP